MMELAKMAKITSMITEKNNIYIYGFKPFTDFLHETERKCAEWFVVLMMKREKKLDNRKEQLFSYNYKLTDNKY